jgi:hypothetical protein
MAASTLAESDRYWGARFRYLRARRGSTKAIKAMAAYRARLIYCKRTKGQPWVDRGLAEFETRRKLRQEQALRTPSQGIGVHFDTRSLNLWP